MTKDRQTLFFSNLHFLFLYSENPFGWSGDQHADVQVLCERIKDASVETRRKWTFLKMYLQEQVDSPLETREMVSDQVKQKNEKFKNEKKSSTTIEF